MQRHLRPHSLAQRWGAVSHADAGAKVAARSSERAHAAYSNTRLIRESLSGLRST